MIFKDKLLKIKAIRSSTVLLLASLALLVSLASLATVGCGNDDDGGISVFSSTPAAGGSDLRVPDLASEGVLQTIARNSNFQKSFSNIGGASVEDCNVTPSLPAGLSASPTESLDTCQIIGSPIVAASQTAYAVTAINSAGEDPTPATITIEVTGNLAVPNIDSIKNRLFEFSTGTQIPIILFTNSGGTALNRCSTDPDLPAGLQVRQTSNRNSCQISGTPTTPVTRQNYKISGMNAAGTQSSGTAARISIAVVAALRRPDLQKATDLVVTQRESIVVTFVNNGGAAISNCSTDPALPSGLRLSPTSDQRTCQITGAAQQIRATAQYRITAKNSSGDDLTAATILIEVTAALALPDLENVTSAVSITVAGAANIPFINTGGRAITSCAVTPSLPAGLKAAPTNDNGSCQITGTASAPAVQRTYSISARNATGLDDSFATVTLQVLTGLPVPNLENAPDVLATSGGSLRILFANTGGGSVTDCRISPALPTGLDIAITPNQNSCLISGSSDAITRTQTYMITARNATGADSTAASVAINLAVPGLKTASSATDFVFPSQQTIAPIAFTNTGGGITSCTVSPGLPSGLLLNTSTCAITGTPAAETAKQDYVVTANNASGAGTVTVAITITAQIPNISLGSIDSSQTFRTTQMITPLVFVNSGGQSLTSCTISPALPAGLRITRSAGNTSCQITGAATVADTNTHTVMATNAGGSNTLQIMITVLPIDGSGTVADPFLVGTAADMACVGRSGTRPFTGVDCSSKTTWNLNSHYRLTSNIDLLGILDANANGRIDTTMINIDATGSRQATVLNTSNDRSWLPIGSGATSSTQFTGTFDGQNNAISNLWVRIESTSSSNGGLFATLSSGGAIRNLRIASGNIAVASSTTSGANYVGAIAGRVFNATIANSSAAINVAGVASNLLYIGGLVGAAANSTISQSFASGTVGAFIQMNVFNLYIGGLAGQISNNAIVINSYATGIIVGASDASSPANIYAGGFAGQNASGTVGNSYANGATTLVSSGVSFGGGFVGQNAGTIRNSYSTGAVSANGHSSSGDEARTGGFAGDNSGALTNIYTTGSVTVTASVSGNSDTGGLVGYLSGGTVTHSYNTGNISSTATSSVRRVGGLIGQIASGNVSGAHYFVDNDGGTIGIALGGGGSCGTGVTCSRRTAAQIAALTSVTGWATNDWSFGNTNQLPALKYTQINTITGNECDGDTGLSCGALLPGQPKSP